MTGWCWDSTPCARDINTRPVAMGKAPWQPRPACITHVPLHALQAAAAGVLAWRACLERGLLPDDESLHQASYDEPCHLPQQHHASKQSRGPRECFQGSLPGSLPGSLHPHMHACMHAVRRRRRWCPPTRPACMQVSGAAGTAGALPAGHHSGAWPEEPLRTMLLRGLAKLGVAR